jgi:hypothetical protein
MKYMVILIISGLLIAGCKHPDDEASKEVANSNDSGIEQAASFESIQVPEGFDFKTSRKIGIDIQVFDDNGNPLSEVEVTIFKDMKVIKGGPTSDSRTTIPINQQALGYTDASGSYLESIVIPTAVDLMYVQVNLFGLENLVPAYIQDDSIQLTFEHQGA